MTDVTRNLIDLAVAKVYLLPGTSADQDAIRKALTDILGTRFDELENLLHVLTNRAGQQAEILARNAERKDA